jgi:translation initiation factor 5
MATVNIRRDVKDSFYRYKMPKLLSKIEGKGNGIKTVIPNMAEIGKSLNRPPSYPTKYFGCELGAQVKCDEKTEKYIVNGAHDAARLQQLLDGFIQKFVLCTECSNPETDLVITKDGDIIRDCKACGQRTLVDMRHKLVTFILKNPPESAVAKNGKKDKKGKRAGKAGANGSPPSPEDSPDHSPECGSDEGSDDELTRRIQAEAADLPPEGKVASQLDDWSEDTSAQAVAARQKALSGVTAKLAEKLTLEDDEDDGEGKIVVLW